MLSIYKNKGFTLLETLLVTAIAAALIFVGLLRYAEYKRQQQIDTLQQHVDLLFRALARYYQANCLDGAKFPTQGRTVQPIPIKDLLFAEKYLPAWPLPLNVLVDDTYGEKGYFTQYNPSREVEQVVATS